MVASIAAVTPVGVSGWGFFDSGVVATTSVMRTTDRDFWDQILGEFLHGQEGPEGGRLLIPDAAMLESPFVKHSLEDASSGEIDGGNNFRGSNGVLGTGGMIHVRVGSDSRIQQDRV
ncbi:hypothetical protein CRG98_008633 [Punica granatum]|uniref:Uncharacterized protein n=1 Tax=Punica granatum TaxID=22663 RepID=A0A2I0KRE0_PUNGR|nr:hypothetical protein CRG98_008633 [Punica granatum]